MVLSQFFIQSISGIKMIQLVPMFFPVESFFVFSNVNLFFEKHSKDNFNNVKNIEPAIPLIQFFLVTSGCSWSYNFIRVLCLPVLHYLSWRP